MLQNLFESFACKNWLFFKRSHCIEVSFSKPSSILAELVMIVSLLLIVSSFLSKYSEGLLRWGWIGLYWCFFLFCRYDLVRNRLAPLRGGYVFSGFLFSSIVGTAYAIIRQFVCLNYIENTSVSVCFRGISRLPSALVFLRWFKLAHISIQVCTFHDGCKQRIDQQIFNRKSISRKITHPLSLFNPTPAELMDANAIFRSPFTIDWHTSSILFATRENQSRLKCAYSGMFIGSASDCQALMREFMALHMPVSRG